MFLLILLTSIISYKILVQRARLIKFKITNNKVKKTYIRHTIIILYKFK
jgi:hypothetical protein